MRGSHARRIGGVFFHGKSIALSSREMKFSIFILRMVYLESDLSSFFFFFFFNVKTCNTFYFRMFTASLLGVIMLLICQNVAKADEVPAFFLKIAKIPTLPRVGRSGRFENFFYKAEKHIPRIGRNIQVGTALLLFLFIRINKIFIIFFMIYRICLKDFT